MRGWYVHHVHVNGNGNGITCNVMFTVVKLCLSGGCYFVLFMM